jgi:DNA-binding CsgD family transcriptional regulator
MGTPVATRGLLERENELSSLEDQLRGACTGRGRCLLIRGPAGIGKTRLIEELCSKAKAEGLTVLRARCGELEREFAFGIIRELFESRLARASPAERRRFLAGAAALAAPLLGLPDSRPSAAHGDPTYPALHGLYWLLANLTEEGPLVLAVDDGHFCDGASLRWFAFLARRLEELPVLLALAVRSGEPGTDVILEQFALDPATRLLQPAPLSPAAVAVIVSAELGADATPELCSACHQATGGNPFLLRELLSELSASGLGAAATAEEVAALGPEAIGRAVLVRLGRLPAEAAALARAVVILGDGVELPRAAAFADVEFEAAEETVDALTRAEILAAGRPLGFVHPIVRAGISAELGTGERAQAHSRAARLLAADGAEPQELAPHLIATEPAGDESVVATLRRAARWARERGSLETANACLARAIREPPAPSEQSALLFELGTVEVRLGLGDASEHIRSAREASGDAAERATASAELALALLQHDRWREAVEILERALAELGDRHRELRLRLERQLIAYRLFDAALRPGVAARLSALRSEDGDEGPGSRALLALDAFERVLAGAPATEVSALGERALAGGDLARYVGVEGFELYCATVGLVFAERYDLAAASFTSIVSQARREGSALGFALASCFRALQLLREGRLDEAEADARAALGVVDQGSWRTIPFGTLIETLIERGELRGARRELARAEAEGSPDGNLQFNILGHSRGRLLVAERELKAGLEQLLEVGRRQTDWGVWNPSLLPWRSHTALALLSLREGERANELATEEVAFARAVGAPRALGVALRASGLVEGGERGLELLAEAVYALETSPAILERARALVDLGAALRRAGRTIDAREPLRRGLDLAYRSGATPLAERARHELRATGVRPRRPTLSGIESLTPSERRVAELVAGGMSNREAAQALFVTEKTIEAHLGSTYRKLDIHSRTELSAALARAQPSPTPGSTSVLARQ